VKDPGMTDRPLSYPHGFRAGPGAHESGDNPARTRWLEQHDVHTEFLDAGIGCCWLAEKGDHGAVMGETEDSAIAQLAKVNGWELWTET
jgi:hypothetical protein